MKLSGLFVFANFAEAQQQEVPQACTELPIWADLNNGTGVIQNQAWLENRSYNSGDTCVWELKSGNSDRLMIRFNNFDTADSKLCDNNPANDKRGDRSVFEFEFHDGENWYTEKLCHSTGEDRHDHKTGARGRSAQVRSFAGGNPKKWKHGKFGDNLMGWTQINAKSVKLTFSVGPKANNQGRGPYRGFRLEYATISDMTLEELRLAIIDFVMNDENYDDSVRAGKKLAFQRFIKSKLVKAHKQNAQKCRTEAPNVPKFIKEKWVQVNSMKKLVEFLSVEDGKDKGASGFKGYFDFVHAGCWRKIDQLENMQKWHDNLESYINL